MIWLVAAVLLAGAGCNGDTPPAPRSLQAACRSVRAEAAKPHPALSMPLSAALESLGPEARASITASFAGLAGAMNDAASAMSTTESGADRGASRRLAREAEQLTNITAADPTDTPTVRGVIERGLRLTQAWPVAVRGLDTRSCTDVDMPRAPRTTPAVEPVTPSLSCFDVANFDPLRPRPLDDASAREPISCDATHDAVRYAAFRYPAGDEVPYPGDIPLAWFAAVQCHDRLMADRTESYFTGRLAYTADLPDETAWSAGEREMACLVYDITGRPLPAATAGSR